MKKRCLLFGRVLLGFLVFEAVSFLLPELWAIVLSGRELEREQMHWLYQFGRSLIVIFLAFPAYVLVLRAIGTLKRFSFREKERISGAAAARYMVLSVCPVFLLYGAAAVICGMQGIPVSSLTGSLTAADAVRELLIGCCLMPLAEELMFRGVVLGILKEGGSLFAVLVSTIFFALGHSNPVNVILGFLTGILFSHIALRYQGIRFTFACHVVVNVLGNLIVPLILQMH